MPANADGRIRAYPQAREVKAAGSSHQAGTRAGRYVTEVHRTLGNQVIQRLARRACNTIMQRSAPVQREVTIAGNPFGEAERDMIRRLQAIHTVTAGDIALRVALSPAESRVLDLMLTDRETYPFA